MSPAIRVSNLSKRYKLGLTHAGSIRELASRWTDRLLGRKAALLPHELAKASGSAAQIDEEGCFWALKGVSFEVQPGEALGIIGRNGAGKSTVLKILSRITAPTEGRIEINGRVASLLEVGTGFHPELTGRENVFLNGAILGMTKAEIRRRFDEIVAFAEIEKFIDTPVKRYSSGMYVRLAFAVAAHLEPEILIVDEVLAVGDADFQKKCLGKMQDVAHGGRTVLFVSHNLIAVRKLCQSAILLTNGTITSSGGVQGVVDDYFCSLAGRDAAPTTDSIAENRERGVTLRALEILDQQGRVLDTLQSGRPARLCLVIESARPFEDVTATIGVNSDLEDVRVCIFYSPLTGDRLRIAPGLTLLGLHDAETSACAGATN